jgi:acyl-CoA thioesterase I
MREPVAKADTLQPVTRARHGIGAAAKLQRHGDILNRCQRRDQMKRLEHDADIVPAEARQLILALVMQCLPRHGDGATGDWLESGDHHEQRRLAGARWPDYAKRFAGLGGKCHIAQDVHSASTRWQSEIYIFECNCLGGRKGQIGLINYVGHWPCLQVTPDSPIWMIMRRFSILPSLFFAFALFAVSARAEPLTVLALGDSLTAGYGLDPSAAFPARLAAALKAKGNDVVVINAGVSGDTAAQGEARLDWALTDDVDAVIVELGANDALRGLEPSQAEAALVRILDKVKAKGLPTLIAGMRAPPNLGPDYQAKFDPMFERQAKAFDALLYPFFLEGVAAQASLNQSDGIHPNVQGVDIIVEKILPSVEQLLSKVQ